MKHNLTGKMFGRLTVSSRSEIKNKRRWWWCNCECGSYVLISQNKLLHRDRKYCALTCAYLGEAHQKISTTTRRKCTDCKEWTEANRFPFKIIEKKGIKRTRFNSKCTDCQRKYQREYMRRRRSLL